MNDAIEADDNGRGVSARPVFRRLATEGLNAPPPGTGRDGRPGIAGAAPGGGFGADIDGGFGADDLDDSGSERYEASGFARHTERR